MSIDIKKEFHLALGFHQNGKLKDAKLSYEKILSVEPDHFDTLHLIGMVENQSGNYQIAIQYLQKALSINQNIDFVFNNLGEIYLNISDYESALLNFNKALDLNKNYEKAHFNIAEIFRRQELYKESLESYDKCLQINRNNLNAHINKGFSLFKTKQFKQAILSLDTALKLDPKNLNATVNKAQCFYMLKDYKAAIDLNNIVIQNYKQHFISYFQNSKIFMKLNDYENALTNIDNAIKFNHENHEVYFLKASILAKLKLYNEAIAYYDKTISFKKDHYQTYNDKGNIFFLKNNFDEAIIFYEQAININNNYSSAYFNLGKAYLSMGKLDASLEQFILAVKKDPNFIECFNYLGIVFRELKKYDKAYFYFKQALISDPKNNTYLSNLIFLQMNLNHWLFEIDTKKETIFDYYLQKKINVPFVSIVSCDDPKLHQKIAQEYIKKKLSSESVKNYKFNQRDDKKIKIGYFSSDFTTHPVSQLLVELIEAHDKNRFEIIAFSLKTRNNKDPLKKRLLSYFDKFIEVENLETKEIVNMSRSIPLDIAIDLNGHTKFARTEIFLKRVAPIQINFLGYPGTMGTNLYDYIIADEIVIPFKNQKFYDEKVVYLPHSFQVNPSKRNISNKIFKRSELGLPEKGFIFCCFNNNYKILPETFKIWMKILKKVKNSVLWLQQTNEFSKTNLYKEVKKADINPNRLIFATYLNEMNDHLARIKLADLFLDTYPYNAHTTASDALWAGLPILTRIGNSFSSRVAASLLNSVGLQDLITNSDETYMQLAIKLGNDPNKLNDIKQKLIESKNTSPLFNTKLYTQNLEQAFALMLNKLNKNSPTENIIIKS